jgi:tetratricopeptide (TPR) repeat protein
MKAIKYLPLAIIGAIFYCMGLQSIYAQSLKDQALADSLISELPKTKSDTDQVKLLSKLARVLTPFNPDEALNYANKAMDLAKKANWTTGIGLAHMNKATIYVTITDYAAGLENANKAYEIFKSLNWKSAMANALVEISNGYENLGNYSKAIEHNFDALSIYEEAGMDKDVANVSTNIGNGYYWLLEYSKAIENYKRALQLYKKIGNKLGTATALDNIALVYSEEGEYKKANEYNLQAIKLFEEINDPPELAITYSIRGSILQKQKDFTAALEYHNKAMAINQRFDIKGNLVTNYESIGDMYLSIAKNETVKSLPASFKISKTALIQKARFYFTKALQLSKQTNRLILMMQETALLSETEALAGNNKAALAWYKESTQYKDSIFNDENKKKIAALENQRLAEVKDKEIQLLNKDKALQASEIERQMLIKNIIIAAVVVAAIFTFFLTRSFIRRRKVMFDKQVLQTEMKALRAQMNPHFIFNSLHSINRYIMENDKVNASEYLSKFARLMRLVLENSREQEVPLENDLAALELYMQLESLRFENRFQYKIEIDPGIDKENTLIPPLMLQPFAENAIVHGVKDKEDGLIKINIHSENDNMIRCVVEDNGKGRGAPPVTEESNRKRKSLGMKITQERLNIINQLKKAKAVVHIFDLKDAENKPGGLRIELLLPLQLAF